ncbi:MAG TPA: hypothetical protein VEZ90_08945 [Blastocatellia bacterium]|nr:hypothetical protein [Blastocatellia bacterium]
MLRPQFLKKVYEQLNTSGFRIEDFTVTSNKEDTDTGKGKRESVFLTIRYNFDERYSFHAVETVTLTNDLGFNVIRKPGRFLETETHTVTPDAMVSLLPGWLNAISEDMAARPWNRDLSGLRETVENILRETSELADDYFTKEEGDGLKLRLSELEARLKNEIGQTSEGQAANRASLDELQRDFSQLRTTVDGLTKKNWAGQAIVRVNAWMRIPAVKALLSAGANALVKGLIGDGSDAHHQ